jgi:hypothetical protein
MRDLEEIKTLKRIWRYMPVYEDTYCGLIKLPDCGTCTVMFGYNENGYEHVSVSPTHQFRVPTWEDMCYVKDTFWKDEEEAFQLHPKKSQYVNLKENCLHLWAVKGHEIGELVKNEID